MNGATSVRITRRVLTDGTRQLLIDGPQQLEERHTFTDIVACVSAQIRIEQRLVAQGYALEKVTVERRGVADRRAQSRTDGRNLDGDPP